MTNREWAAKQKAAGKCECCTKDRVTARHCRKHAKAHSLASAKHMAKVRADGLCKICSREPWAPGKAFCAKHRKTTNAYENKRRRNRVEAQVAKGQCVKPGCRELLATRTLCKFHRQYQLEANRRHKEKLLTAQH